MRYRTEQLPFENKVHASQTIVDVTVFTTLLIGLLFVIAGIKGSQTWLFVWGALTIVMCSIYYWYIFFG